MTDTIKLSYEDTQELLDMCDDFESFNPVTNSYDGVIPYSWQEIVRSCHLSVDEQLHALLLGGENLILISNIPVPDNLEESPYDTKWRTDFRPLPTDILHYKIADILNTTPKTYPNEHNGNHIHNITPVFNHEGEFSSAGDCDFPYHVEVPQDECNPKHLSLACLRGDSKVGTSVFYSKRLLDLLTDEELLACKQPIMKLKVSPSFGNVGEVSVVPILRDNYDGFFVFDSVEMKPIPDNELSISIYNKFMAGLAEEPNHTHYLSTGEMMIVNNRTVLHSRSIKNTISSSRWLTRMYYK